MKEQFKNMKEKLYTLLTLVNASVGNDTPREKPKTTPTKVARRKCPSMRPKKGDFVTRYTLHTAPFTVAHHRLGPTKNGSGYEAEMVSIFSQIESPDRSLHDHIIEALGKLTVEQGIPYVLSNIVEPALLSQDGSDLDKPVSQETFLEEFKIVTMRCSNTTVNTHRRRTKHAIGRSRRRPAKVTKKTQKKLFREEEEGFEEGCEGHQ
ncbi:hypothetical protein JHK84_052514 [Glycine max]|nr:hypothetical protein JHK84_052514 [Glycine max]